VETPNYYEFLQISPNADQDTVHRVYRFLAARFHPDNPESGDVDKFHLLKQAYDVLSDSARRAQYDAGGAKETTQPDSSFIEVDFMDKIDGELNRRLAVLALLYLRRRTNPGYPEVSLAEVETRMAFPRDYLEFTMWYLQKKAYISRADNAAYTLTADGVDFVETQRESIPTLNKLLTSGTESSTNPKTANDAYIPPRKPIIVPPVTPHPATAHSADRRVNKTDRRSKQTDRRSK
jgi:curved DNA-binding protein CbpA